MGSNDRCLIEVTNLYETEVSLLEVGFSNFVYSSSSVSTLRCIHTQEEE